MALNLLPGNTAILVLSVTSMEVVTCHVFGPTVLLTVAGDAKPGTMCTILISWHILEQFQLSKAKKTDVRILRPLRGLNCLEQPHVGPPPTAMHPEVLFKLSPGPTVPV